MDRFQADPASLLSFKYLSEGRGVEFIDRVPVRGVNPNGG
jgi:hypothetical protein